MGRGKTRRTRHARVEKASSGCRCSGSIRAHALTEATVADATVALELLEAVDGGLASVTGDAAYDTVAFYEAAGDRGATVVVPPTKTAKVSGRRRRSSARDRTIRKVT